MCHAQVYPSRVPLLGHLSPSPRTLGPPDAPILTAHRGAAGGKPPKGILTAHRGAAGGKPPKGLETGCSTQ